MTLAYSGTRFAMMLSHSREIRQVPCALVSLMEKGDFPQGGAYQLFAQDVVTVAGFSWTQAVFDSYQTGLNFPTTSYGNGAGQNGILGPNFAVSVPEPSTIVLLLAAGLTGMLAYGWRWKQSA